MKRATVLLTCVIVLVSTAGIAYGQLGSSRTGTGATAGAPALAVHGRAAVNLPVDTPAADDQHAHTYGFRSSNKIAAALRGGERSATPADSGASAGATVTITATVLPVRTIVVRDGRVTQVHSNTSDLEGTRSLYQVRTGSIAGESVTLTDSVWLQARQMMRRSDVAIGRIA